MEAIGSVRNTGYRGNEAIAGGGDSTQSHTTTQTTESTVSEVSSPRRDEAEKSSLEKVERVALAMDEYLKSHASNLKIQVNQGTGDVVVKVIATEDGRTIRQIPSEKALNLAANMEKTIGALFSKKV